MKQIIVALIIGISMMVSAWIISSGLREAGKNVESAGNDIKIGLAGVGGGLSYAGNSINTGLNNSKPHDLTVHLGGTTDAIRVQNSQ